MNIPERYVSDTDEKYRGFIKSNNQKLIKNLDMKELLDYYLSTYKEDHLEEDEYKQLSDMFYKLVTPRNKKFDRDDYMMINGKIFSPRRIGSELIIAKGNFQRFCINTGCKREKIEQWVEKNDDTRHIYNQVKEMILDYVEDHLMRLVESGDRGAITYYLNCKGQMRGYGSYEQRRRVGEILKDSKMKIGDNDKVNIIKMGNEKKNNDKK